MLHIVMTCGCGTGSSVILKMNAKRVLKSLGTEARFEASDIAIGRDATRTTDLVLTGRELAHFVQDIDKPIIQLIGFVNKQEIKGKPREYYEVNGIKRKL